MDLADELVLLIELLRSFGLMMRALNGAWTA